MTGQNIIHFIDQISREKGLDREIIIDAIKAAVVTAARKRYSSEDSLEVEMDTKTGEISICAVKTVVEQVDDSSNQIDLETARNFQPQVDIGDEVKIPLQTGDFGRIAAQTAKQVILQRVREAERKRIHDDYQDKVGELVHGVVQRQEKGNIIVELGKAEGILPKREQSFRENLRKGDHIRAYVMEVKDSSKGPQIILSRTYPDLLVKLFELEVPEIGEKIVEIKNAAREPSGRSKIAVISNDSNVDPVGACVGMRGSRVQAVVYELRGEKIDIIQWNEDPVVFVKNALSPAEVKEVIVHEEDRSMEVIVDDDQLSLAIGKKGQNVRLAAKLTQWKIDIKSQSAHEQGPEPEAEEAAHNGETPAAGEAQADEADETGEEGLQEPVEETPLEEQEEAAAPEREEEASAAEEGDREEAS